MSTALIHADLADLCQEMGDTARAAEALDRASAIAPTKQKFQNRKARIIDKAEKQRARTPGFEHTED